VRTYFFDENLSKRLPAMLAALGVAAMHQSDHFPSGTLDTVWIPEIGRREYVLITWDRKTRTRPAEAEALRTFGVTTIYLGPFWGKKQFWAQATWLVKHWPGTEDHVRGCMPGTVAMLQERGNFRRLVLGHIK